MERRHPPYPYDRRDPRSEPPYDDSFYAPYPDRYGDGIGRYPPGYDPRYPPPPPPRRGGWLPPSFYWAGLLVAVTTAIALLFDPGKVFSRGAQKPNRDCQEVVQPQSVLSREELAQVLAVPERDSRDRIRAIVAEPYCVLPGLTIRAGVMAVREAYPLEFDPETWLIILYEGEEYAGYRFIYR